MIAKINITSKTIKDGSHHLDIPMFVFTFAFIVMTGNVLEPEPLTLFNAALGIFTAFSIVGIALQTVIARRIAAAQNYLVT